MSSKVFCALRSPRPCTWARVMLMPAELIAFDMAARRPGRSTHVTSTFTARGVPCPFTHCASMRRCGSLSSTLGHSRVCTVTPRPVKVEVTCVDRPGLLAAMSKAISSAGINITRAQVHTLGDRKAQNTFELMVGSLDELNRVMRSLGRVRGVMKVARVRT